MHWLSDVVAYVLPFIVGLSVLVFVHELGHYLFARLNNVKVETFSVGFGREIWGMTDKHGTRWRVSWLPFGGYVMMAGDKDAASAPDVEKLANMPREEFNKTLYSKSALQKISVFGGGPLGNYIYGFFVIAAAFFFRGAPDNRVKVEDVVARSPAAEAGITRGDVIESVNGEKIETAQDLYNIIAKNNDKVLDIQVSRADAFLSVGVVPREMFYEASDNSETTKRKMIGVVFAPPEIVKVGLWEATKRSGRFCLKISGDIMRALARLVAGSDEVKNLGGPVRIAKLFGDAFKTGDVSKLIIFSAMLSINLGFINLLPLPALDGGSIIISLVELITRRPLSKKLQEATTQFGFVLLMGFMLFVTCNDILHLGVFSKIKSVFAGFCQ
ncbi:MAG: RIP metalloprotease RseP [Holosporales bacterium]|jgi:regulator of sigma E protease|nr:RIP metalloprotease RseP [Holosporales bacterium]